MNDLVHLAIIMDGNGRWAKLQGKPRTHGHQQGINALRNITIWCAKERIAYLTLYAFSTENWSRPQTEVDFLMRMLKKYLIQERPTYLEHKIRFKAIGNLKRFNPALQKTILSLEQETAEHTALTQVLALNYGGRDEIARACGRVLELGLKGNLQELIGAHLDTAGLPDVDLLVRTGGEMRLSNFLLWQSSYAELFFSPVLWPDFTPTHLAEIIALFNQRQRKFGRV
ncbi:Undecaprenyl pyrophosphate synthase UppS [Helicobacter ailurogastricus]|uniref:Isoprenyl transferase n=2 Tax=Helicobacter ailurogastricus TaxID=1578720 RepID=A0A0K2XZL3_9HELI|nr:Undecaprenyl diphosphate synthase [Helicobacter ailurogastricus]CRF43421.1 Undecaprenyl diphosphate synthase [Helicobacter ailurogastricus]CRF43974.1 Undecaprenyl diphosphate synthase [Helicobacter ailurogastricus]CRF52536.1 Undecaprenyl pyrophosphate synthetase [Helicobacter ailurogastricus]BDQ29674.1 isoprenyl transferase [Helicobacter ailurogastricus]